LDGTYYKIATRFVNGKYAGEVETPCPKMTLKKSLPMLAWEGQEICRLMESWVEEAFGVRCQEPSEGCPCCEAWKAYDEVRKVVEGMKP